MKKITILILTLATTLALHAQVAINTTGAVPDNSAMLDVQSTTTGMLVPRMNTTQRTTISSPANGLLVYDTTTQSFWFYQNSIWTELRAGNITELSDTDGDTKVEVEETADEDRIRLYSNNVNSFTFDSLRIETGNNSVFIGRGTGGTSVINNNVAVGDSVLFQNTSFENTGIGSKALCKNMSGSQNTAVGAQTLYSNTIGNSNSAFGSYALWANTSGQYNTAVGISAAGRNTIGEGNIAVGFSALFLNHKGSGNTVVGSNAARGWGGGNDSIVGNSVFGEASGFYLRNGGNYNSFYGYNSGFNSCTGSHNTAFGNSSLKHSGNGNNNTAMGDSSLFHSYNGNNNTALGAQTLFYNYSNQFSTAVGYQAMYYADSRAIGRVTYNTAVGYQALYGSSTPLSNYGRGNSSLGHQTLWSNTSGDDNTGTGSKALYNNTTGSNNVASGHNSLYNNETGYSNVAIGISALYSNTTRSNLVAIGDSALYSNSSGIKNTANGSKALYSNTTGYCNVASGYHTLYSNQTGFGNAACGYKALENVESNGNCGIGYQVMAGVTTAYNNSAIGADAYPAGNYYNSTALGHAAAITDNNMVKLGDNSVIWIGGHSAWHNTSDGRFKKNVKENIPGLEFIVKLRPVSYTWDIDALNKYMGIPDSISGLPVADRVKAEQTVHVGFVAQEVEKAAGETGFDFDGIHHPANKYDPYSLAYAQFVIPLVKAVQEQQAVIEKQNKKIDDLKQEVSKMKAIEQRLENLEKQIAKK